MDPLSVAASTVGLAVFAAKTAKTIATYIEQFKTTDSALKNLQSELSTLNMTLLSMEAMLRRDDFSDAFRKAASGEEMIHHLVSLEAIFEDCKKTIQEFEVLLHSIRAGRLSSSVLRKPTSAWKLNSKASELGRLQHLLGGYHRALQINLQIMNLIVSTQTKFEVQHVNASLDEIKAGILQLRFNFQTRAEKSQDGDTLVANSLEQALLVSENIISSASEYYGSTAGTTRTGNASPVNFNDHDMAEVEKWAKISTRDTNETMYPYADDDSDAEMASELIERADKYFEKGDFLNAKRFYNAFLEKSHSISLDSKQIFQATLNLAFCHSANGKYKDAQLALRLLDNDSTEYNQRLLIKQYLGEIFYLDSDLEKAKQSAKYAMRGQKKGSDLYYNSVSLLAVICVSLGQIEEAEVYHSRVPSEFKPTRIPGWEKVVETKSKVNDVGLQSTEEIGEEYMERMGVTKTAVQSEGTEKLSDSDKHASGIETKNPIRSYHSGELLDLGPLQEEWPSGHSSEPTDITFINRTQNSRISVLWIDWDGYTRHYVDVDAGQSNRRPTYRGHVWRVIDADSKRLIASFCAVAESSTATITDEMHSLTRPIVHLGTHEASNENLSHQ